MVIVARLQPLPGGRWPGKTLTNHPQRLSSGDKNNKSYLRSGANYRNSVLRSRSLLVFQGEVLCSLS